MRTYKNNTNSSPAKNEHSPLVEFRTSVLTFYLLTPSKATLIDFTAYFCVFSALWKGVGTGKWYSFHGVFCDCGWCVCRLLLLLLFFLNYFKIIFKNYYYYYYYYYCCCCCCCCYCCCCGYGILLGSWAVIRAISCCLTLVHACLHLFSFSTHWRQWWWLIYHSKRGSQFRVFQRSSQKKMLRVEKKWAWQEKVPRTTRW